MYAEFRIKIIFSVANYNDFNIMLHGLNNEILSHFFFQNKKIELTLTTYITHTRYINSECFLFFDK